MALQANSPTSEGNSPASGANSPTVEGNSPTLGVKSPTGEGNSPTFGANSPTGEGYSPTLGVNSPTGEGNSPTLGANSPTGVHARAVGVVQAPRDQPPPLGGGLAPPPVADLLPQLQRGRRAVPLAAGVATKPYTVG
eukprot:827574-Prorocentrum_minimum.AAC.1